MKLFGTVLVIILSFIFAFWLILGAINTSQEIPMENQTVSGRMYMLLGDKTLFKHCRALIVKKYNNDRRITYVEFEEIRLCEKDATAYEFERFNEHLEKLLKQLENKKRQNRA